MNTCEPASEVSDVPVAAVRYTTTRQEKGSNPQQEGFCTGVEAVFDGELKVLCRFVVGH